MQPANTLRKAESIKTTRGSEDEAHHKLSNMKITLKQCRQYEENSQHVDKTFRKTVEHLSNTCCQFRTLGINITKSRSPRIEHTTTINQSESTTEDN